MLTQDHLVTFSLALTDSKHVLQDDAEIFGMVRLKLVGNSGYPQEQSMHEVLHAGEATWSFGFAFLVRFSALWCRDALSGGTGCGSGQVGSGWSQRGGRDGES